MAREILTTDTYHNIVYITKIQKIHSSLPLIIHMVLNKTYLFTSKGRTSIPNIHFHNILSTDFEVLTSPARSSH